MASTVTRNMVVTYAGLAAGGTNAVEIDGPVRHKVTYESVEVTFTAVVTGTTDAAFVTNCTALEDAYRLIRQTLTLEIGSSTWRSYVHNANTGFDAYATCVQDLTRQSSIRKRYYRCSVVTFLPANLAGENGLYDSHIEVTTQPNDARILRVSGVYTGLASKDATEQYEDSITAYVAGIVSNLTGVWETVTARYGHPRTDKRLNFIHVLHELVTDQSEDVNVTSAPYNDPEVKVMTYRFLKTQVGVLDSDPDATKPWVGIIRYSATIIKSVDAQEKWEGELRDWVMGNAAETLGVSTLVLKEDTFEIEKHSNRIHGVLTVEGYTATHALRYSFTHRIQRDFGTLRIPVWTKSRNPFARFLFPAPQTMRRIRLHTLLTTSPDTQRGIAAKTVLQLADKAPGTQGFGHWFTTVPYADETDKAHMKDGWLLVAANTDWSPIADGKIPYQIDLFAVTEVIIEERVDEVVGITTGATEEGKVEASEGSDGSLAPVPGAMPFIGGGDIHSAGEFVGDR